VTEIVTKALNVNIKNTDAYFLLNIILVYVESLLAIVLFGETYSGKNIITVAAKSNPNTPIITLGNING